MRRILSLLLAVLMVLAVVPVMSMAAFAGEAQPVLQGTSEFTPTKGNISDYAGLWYDDGHLMAFVDMTGLTGKVTTADNLDENALLVQGGTAANDYNAMHEGKHWYIKIIGGAFAGKYYMLSGVYDASLNPAPIALDANGNIDFTVKAMDTSDHNSSGIYLTHAFAASDIVSTATVKNAVLDDYLKIDSSATGAFTFELVSFNRGHKAGYTGTNNALIGNAAYMNNDESGTVTQVGLNIVNNDQITLRDGTPVYSDSACTTVVRNDRPVLVSNANIAKNSIFHYAFTNTYLSITESEMVKDSTTTYPNTGKMLISGKLLRTADALVGIENEREMKDFTGYVNTGEGVVPVTVTEPRYSSFRDYDESRIQLMNLSTGLALTHYFIRTYDVDLTVDQMRRNHFADICYYYGLNTEALEGYDLSLSGANASDDEIVADIFDIFAMYDIGALDEDDVKKLNAALANPENAKQIVDNWGFVPTTDTEFEKYKALWYDNGHLEAFFDLTELNDAGNTVTLADNPTEEQINAAKFVIGEKTSAKNELGTHYFAKATGGRLAGRFFLVGGDARKLTGGVGESDIDGSYPCKIVIREDGLLDCYTPWSNYPSSGSGIYLQYMFSASKLATSFAGINGLGASGAIETGLFDSYDEVAYTGTYGHLTLDVAALVGDSGYGDDEEGFVRYKDPTTGVVHDYRNRAHTIGLMKYGTSPSDFGDYNELRTFGHLAVNESNTIYAFGVGADGNSIHGATASLTVHPNADKTEVGNSRHYTLSTKQVTDDNFVLPSIRLLLYQSGVYRATKGTQRSFQIFDTKYSCVSLNAINPYYIRIYDADLTDNQILRNHFADLVYYYRLADEVDIEELMSYGSYALNDNFYQSFSTIHIGVGDAKGNAIAKINAKLTECRELSDVTAVKKLIEDKYAIFYNSTLIINENAATIDGIVADVNAKIQEADNLEAEGEAAEIIDGSKAEFIKVKKDISAYKKQVDNIKNENEAKIALITAFDSSIVNPESLKTYLSSADKTKVFELLAIIDGITDTWSVDATQSYDEAKVITVDAAESKYKIAVAFEISSRVDEIYRYMLSAGAITAIDVEDYIKFAFFQARALDYVGVRAVFAIDDTAMAQGFTMGTSEYDVVSYGFIMAYATDNIDDIYVKYDPVTGKVTSGAVGAKLVSSNKNGGALALDKRYAVTDDARTQALSKTGMNDGANVASISRSFDAVGSSQIRSEYNRKYMYRTYIVFEGEGTSFIKYADVYSNTLKTSSISLYDVVSAAASQVTDNRYLLPELSISKVIFKVTGTLPTKND